MKSFLGLAVLIVFLTSIPIENTAAATVLCAKGTAVKARSTACLNKETTVPIGIGPAGPQGPIGPQGPTGPQGPIGQGVSNLPCSQADIAGVWSFVVNTPNEMAACSVSLDNNGNVLQSRSFCAIGGKPTAYITSGSFKISQPESCFFSASYNRDDGKVWSGLLFVDRTRSNFSGLVASNSSGTSLLSGVRLGSISNGYSTNSLQNNTNEEPKNIDNDPGIAAEEYQQLLNEIAK